MSGSKKRSVLQFLLLLSVGLLLVWLSLKQVAPEKDNIIRSFQNADYFWVGISMFIAFLSHFFRALRWNDLLIPTGHRTRLLNAMSHVFIGYFANYGIPRMGEVSRCTLAAKYDKVPFEIGFGTVITERIVDFFLFLIIFVITLVLQFNDLIGLANKLVFDPLKSRLSGISDHPGQIIILTMGLVVSFALILFFRKRISGLLKGKLGGMLKGMGEGIGSVRKMKRPLRFVLLSVLIWLSYFYSLYTCFFALDGTSQLSQGQGLTLLLFGTFGVIFSPGGLGAYPLILYGILHGTYGLDEVSSFALPWLAWTAQFILIVLFGLLSLLFLPLYNRKKHVPQAA
ncbi:MAG TPA: lysylphosphatidylglycerol synthase transmembrane domain-containing protein [Bacteroidia bacterium]|nr:lysylphosphatidylglycerol synthase transmembrane domain-containing protein [Bacteroidia bacterium]